SSSRSRARSIASACGPKAASTSAPSPRSSGAAGTRTRLAAASPVRWTRCGRCSSTKWKRRLTPGGRSPPTEGTRRSLMDGVLVADKPAGPTSHDVVQRMRRLLKERSIGHTGTLDPMATGVLVLVLGRATRLAQFMSAGDKSYDAVVTLGVSTDTYDADGEPVGERDRGPLPSRDAIDAALDAFRGTFLQQPPAYSAKKIAGERSYKLARLGSDPRQTLPAPVTVTASAIDLIAVNDDQVTLKVDCSAGFYIRS